MNSISNASMMTAADPNLGQAQVAAVNAVMARAKALNAAIAEAVETGLIVEVGRASRYHTDCAAWGDQIAPLVQPR